MVKIPSFKVNRWKKHGGANTLQMGATQDAVSMIVKIDEKNVKKLHRNLEQAKRLFGMALRQGGMKALVQTKNYVRMHRSVRNGPYAKSAVGLANSLRLKYSKVGVQIMSGSSISGLTTRNGFRISQAFHTGTGMKWGKAGSGLMTRNTFLPDDQIVYWHDYFRKGAGRAIAKKSKRMPKKFTGEIDAPAGVINLVAWDSMSKKDQLRAGGKKVYKKGRRTVKKGQKLGGAMPIVPAGRGTPVSVGYARIAAEGPEQYDRSRLRGYPVIPPMKWLDYFAIKASAAIGSRLVSIMRAIHGSQDSRNPNRSLNFNLKQCYRKVLMEEEQKKIVYIRAAEQQVGKLADNSMMSAYTIRRVRKLTTAEKKARREERAAGTRL